MSKRTPEERRRYNSTPNAKAARAAYRVTARGKDVQRVAKAKWNRMNADKVRDASQRRFRELTDRLNAIKLESGCADCGYREHAVALDFDHRDRDSKRANVSALVRRKPWPEILLEVAKCDVVCANCHRIRTYRARHWGPLERPDRPNPQGSLFGESA